MPYKKSRPVSGAASRKSVSVERLVRVPAHFGETVVVTAASISHICGIQRILVHPVGHTVRRDGLSLSSIIH